jgi:hypothetical protein
MDTPASSPTGLTASFINTNPGPATVTWSAMPNAKGYQVEKCLPNTKVFFIVNHLVTSTAWTDVAKRAAVGTQYRISTVTALGLSAPSDPITLKAAL